MPQLGHQQREYQVEHGEGYIEHAIPSQYHVSMKIASSLNPTSLRGIQHYSQKTSQASKMLFSYSGFKTEAEEVQEDEIESEQALSEYI